MSGAHMDFYQKYELMNLLKDEGVKVLNARERATGRQITVFLFVGEQARLHADLLERLRARQRPEGAGLLEVGDHHGTPYVATEPVVGGLAELKQKAAAPTAAGPGAGKAPDAFTRVGVWHVAVATPSGARGDSPATPPPPAAKAEPGEFTRMFQTAPPAQSMGEAAPPAEPVSGVPPPAPPVQAAPGEFTGMFQTGAPVQPMGEAGPPAARPASGVPPPALPTPAAPGEFTRMFQAAPPAQPMGEAAPPAARPASGVPPPALPTPAA